MNDCPVKILQDEFEITTLLNDFFIPLKPLSVLEIGSLYGGTLWLWMNNAPRGARIVSLDKIADNEYHKLEDIMAARQKWETWARRADVNVLKITGDSNNHNVISWVKSSAPFDFIFVDGGHDMKTVNNDWYIYYKMLRPGGVIAFHDIAAPDVNKHNIEVGTWWREMKEHGILGKETFEIIRSKSQWGIGVVRKPKA